MSRRSMTASTESNTRVAIVGREIRGLPERKSRGTSHTMKISKDRDKLWKVFSEGGEELEVEELDLP